MRFLLGLMLLLALFGAVACSEDSGSPTDPGEVFLKADVSMIFLDATSGLPVANPIYKCYINTTVSGRQGPLHVNADGRTERTPLSVPQGWADRNNPQSGFSDFFLPVGQVCKGGVVATDFCYSPKSGPVTFQWVDSQAGGGHWLGEMTVARLVP